MVELLTLYAPSWFRVMVPITPMWAPTPGEITHIGWVCLVLGETKVSGIVVGIEAGWFATTAVESCCLGIKSQIDHIREAKRGWTEEGSISFSRSSSKYLEFPSLLSCLGGTEDRESPSSGTDIGRRAYLLEV